jgi:hypothetical protein
MHQNCEIILEEGEGKRIQKKNQIEKKILCVSEVFNKIFNKEIKTT